MRTHFEALVEKQRRFFYTQKTWSLSYRRAALHRLKENIKKYENDIVVALEKDLGKSAQEAYLTEIGVVYHEINTHLKNLNRWAQPKSVSAPLFLLPSRFQSIPQPLGVALILSPWNYPFQLIINPLIGAISAGCCALLKPSPQAPHINEVIVDLIRETFEPEHVSIVLGDTDVYEPLLQVRYDVIFFTGSPRVGKIIMKAAAEHLCPVILELGGKNPCFVDRDANIAIAARRIVWGKCLNSGQTCIAPDYVLVHESIKLPFVEALKSAYQELYPVENQNNPPEFFGRMISDRAVDRMTDLMEQGQILFGGHVDREKKFVEFTVLEANNLDNELMQSEIFGPLLPIVTFQNLEKSIHEVNSKERPLAAYYFGSSRTATFFSEHILAGGIGINDTIMQIANSNLPFGGVGTSGMGAYHGKHSFDCFTHVKAVVKTPTWIDLPFKYPPFKYMIWVKKLIG